MAMKVRRIDSNVDKLAYVLNQMGQASAKVIEFYYYTFKAQKLNHPVTSYDKLRVSNHTLYLLRDTSVKNVIIGILKVGKKVLFLFDNNGICHENEQFCVLDFYVHESLQRRGHGRTLFEFMLKHQGVTPKDLAIDSPSSNFLSFLKKHYQLDVLIKQNNFVLFGYSFFAHPMVKLSFFR
ncbi:unnamed protein product [Protopolystoma xenopodis]|uniref:Alpha-tubulin N-acetyltransferase n=1 Tax=Protopolystoma xenopodis TaxID=117903 RepID=A0A448WQ57_9PLAT|nr:unnamed protein product [Protopolystoma xenopodis]